MTNKRRDRKYECGHKRKFKNDRKGKKDAVVEADFLARMTGEPVNVYPCRWCGHYHIGHIPSSRIGRTKIRTPLKVKGADMEVATVRAALNSIYWWWPNTDVMKQDEVWGVLGALYDDIDNATNMQEEGESPYQLTYPYEYKGWLIYETASLNLPENVLQGVLRAFYPNWRAKDAKADMIVYVDFVAVKDGMYVGITNTSPQRNDGVYAVDLYAESLRPLEAIASDWELRDGSGRGNGRPLVPVAPFSIVLSR